MSSRLQFALITLFAWLTTSTCFGQFALLSIANTNNGGLAAGIAVSGNNVFLANGTDGLRVYDVSNPTNPINVFHTNNGQFAFGVTIDDHYAFLGESGALGVYDVANPSNPVMLTNASTAYSPTFIFITNALAYVAAQNQFQIFSVSNPASPVRLTARTTYGSLGISASGKYIYVADSQNGLMIYDDSDLLSPLLVSTSKANTHAEDNQVVLSGPYAYLANGPDGLRIYNITNAAAPISVGHTNTGLGESIAISGNYVFMGQSSSVVVIDVSNPSNPLVIAQAPTADLVLGLVVAGDYIYTATRMAGLMVFRLMPKLQVATSGASLLLSWPVTSTPFVLTQSFDVNAANWTPVTNAPALAGQRKELSLPLSSGNVFYRLQQN